MSLQKELEDQIQTCKFQCIGLVSFICLIAIASAVLLITGHRIWGVSCAVAAFSLCLDLERNQRKWDNLKIELEKAKENNRAYKYCAKCGAAIPSGKNFCVECGEHL